MKSYAWPLGSMLATQAAGSAVLATVPVLAPEMALELGVGASFVGVYTGLVFAAATLMLANSGSFIARFGAVGANQLSLLGSSLGLIAVLPSVFSLVILSALLVGMGYGPNTPSSSQVLAQVVPVQRRALAFSIKQSGAPLGGVLAGLTLPWIVTHAGWRVALLTTVVVGLAVALSVEPLRRRLDTAKVAIDAKQMTAKAAMRAVLHDRSVRRLTFGAFLLMLAHGCYQTFFVAYLVEGVGLGLTVAGALYAVLQASAAIGRVALGWLADRLGTSRKVLFWLAAGSFVSSIVCSTFEPDWPLGWLAFASAVIGVSSSGWYGIFLAELARRHVDGVGLATGGALFFVYWAVVVSPFLIALVVYLLGSYAPALWMVAMFSAVAAIVFVRR